VSPVEARDLGEPEAVVTYPLGATYQVRLAGTVVSRHVLQRGWSWEAHAKPQVGTVSCELYHRGVVLSGRMGIRTDEGEELIIGPDQVFDLPPGHVTWVEGDEELVMIDWAGGAGFDTPPGEGARVMATILFSDIVDSTVRARKEGDAAWKHTVTMHEDIVRTVRGERLAETSNGALATQWIEPLQQLLCKREPTGPVQRSRDVRTVVHRFVHVACCWTSPRSSVAVSGRASDRT